MRKMAMTTTAAVLVLTGSGLHLRASTLTRVIVEGLFDEWSEVPVAFVDPTGDNGGSVADIRSVWLANDEEYVYVRFQVGTLTNLQTITGPLRIYFDVDRSAATGWPVGNIGSDFALLFPERYGVEQTSTTFNAAVLRHRVLSLVSGPTVAGTEFELRLRRDAVFPIRGTPIFAGPDFDIVFEGQDTGETTQEWAPDGPLGHTYTLATGSLAPYPPISLEKDHPADVRLMTHNMLWDGLFQRPDPFDRILGALEPDVICFQEVDHSWQDVRDRLDEILPLGESMHWQVYKASDDVVASRWQSSLWAGDTVPSTGRGQAMALVDLPDADYEVDLYVISAHYKCCGSMGGSEDQQRQQHSDANANWFRNLREAGGYVNLPADTPFLICGDLNLVGGPQPLDTLLDGNIVDEATFGPDCPPDWDGSNLADPIPLHNAGPAAYTWREDNSSFAPGRLDFVIYTDSVMSVGKSFVLNTLDMSAEDLAAYGLLAGDTASASDHLPVVVDFRFGQPCPGDLNGDGFRNATDLSCFATAYRSQVGDPNYNPDADLTADGFVNITDFTQFASYYGVPCP